MNEVIADEFRVGGYGSSPILCGQHEAQVRKYKMFLGKSGMRWMVAVQPNEADNVYVEGKAGSDGFGGATLKFELENGEVISLTGPWHSNSSALFADTGYDCRNTSKTWGIIALEVESDWKNGDVYKEILYKDDDWIIGSFNRIKDLAKQYANKLNRKVVFYSQYYSGAMSSWQEPEFSPPNQ